MCNALTTQTDLPDILTLEVRECKNVLSALMCSICFIVKQHLDHSTFHLLIKKQLLMVVVQLPREIKAFKFTLHYIIPVHKYYICICHIVEYRYCTGVDLSVWD